MAFTSRMARILKEEATQRRQLITANLELLPVCNLNCQMCYIRKSMAEVNEEGGLKSVEEWLELAKELRQAGVLFLLLTGGEPFIYSGFRELYEALYKMGFIITINSNATMINRETVEWLGNNPPKCISISLYGASDETYENLCGKKGMFGRIDTAIELLQNKNINIELKTVLNPMNLHEEDKCRQYAETRGVFYESTYYTYPAVRRKERTQQIRFTPQEAATNRFNGNRRLLGDRRYTQKVSEYLSKYERESKVPGEDLYGFTCAASRSSCWITWKGLMTPCAMLEKPCTRPFEQGVIPAWEELKQKCDEILMSPKCSHCEKRSVCNVCPAANYAETGSFGESSPYHCLMTDCTLKKMEKYLNDWNSQHRFEGMEE